MTVFCTQVSFSNLINPSTGKYLKASELILLLDNLQEHSKPALDYLCDRYGYVCSKKASDVTKSNFDENIKDLLLSISASNGSVLSDFIEFNDDNDLDDFELKQLISSSYHVRALLNEFEHSLKTRLKLRS